MRTVVVTGPEQLSIEDIPRPEVGGSDVLVEMKACGLCGSDPHAFHEGFIVPGTTRAHLGHEPAGLVAEVGSDVEDVAVGDHVVINPMASPTRSSARAARRAR
jgi:Zn-dependent alcohol dehydrogenases